MKKTPTPPDNQSGGNQPEKEKRTIRAVLFTPTRWAALLATGNASHALNRLCDEAGIAE